jgi:hypothetical protein
MGIRPSDLYDIEDPLTAYCFDNAVQLFGISLENALSEIDSKANSSNKKGAGKTAQRKKKMELQKWLYSDSPEGAPAGQFRDPAQMRL